MRVDHKCFLWALLGLILCCQSCGEPEKESPVAVIIKSPVISVSEEEFLDELELKKAAYPYKITEKPEEYNELVISLVNTLTEELLLLTAALELGVDVVENEVKMAEDEVKKEYPENGFDQMLMEKAIPYPLWKKRLKTDLIINKLIDQEIKNKVEITSDDLVEFYRKYNAEDKQDSKKKQKESKKPIDENELVSVLRRQKTEEVYGKWLQDLEAKYPIEINMEKIKSLLIDIEKNGGSKNEKAQ